MNFDEIRQELEAKDYGEVTEQDVISYVLYPKVFDQFMQTKQQYGDLSLLDTPTFFFGMRNGETVEIEIDTGKRLIIKLETISEPDENGYRTIYYVMNGQARRISIKDENIKTNTNLKPKVDKSNLVILVLKCGSVTEVKVTVGEEVKVNQPLLITEAMKMETTIQAPFNGTIKQVTVVNGDAIATGTYLLKLKKAD